jgi:cell division ATPase FtsA
MISEARIDELFDYVEKELHKVKRWRKLPGGVVLVGGTANLPGLANFTKEKLQLAARVGHPHSLTGLVEKVSDPAAVTAIGLMLLDILLLPVNQSDKRSKSLMNTKLLNSVSGFFQSFRH